MLLNNFKIILFSKTNPLSFLLQKIVIPNQRAHLYIINKAKIKKQNHINKINL